MIWPSGNSAKLRGAAAAWISAGTNFEVSEILGAVGPMSAIGAQQIPEGPAIAAAFTETNRCAAGILQQCATIATHLTSYASKIDTVHAAIIDLLSRICNPLTGIKEVWEFLTDEDEDEIKKIANDIRIIVNQFTAEVEALGQQIAAALTEAKTIISTMAHYAEREWDHFLHATDVGRALDHVGRILGGFVTEAESAVEGMWNLNPLRAVVDPKGFWRSVSGALEHLETLTGLDGEQKAEESWKGVGKGLAHWDEWSTDPFTAAGETIFDLATVAVPGGALSKLSKLGRLGADAAEAPKGFHVPNPGRLPNPAPHDNPPQRNEPPKGGQPGPAPTAKNTLPPYGVTESKSPAVQKPAPITDPKTAGESPTSTAHAPSSTHAPVTPGAAATPSAALPHSLSTAQPTGGAPSAHAPSSRTPDHHGPVAHAPGPFTSEDLSALGDYTGLGYEDLNHASRTDTMDASQHARADALNRALQKFPPHQGAVFRGTDLPAEVLAQYQPGAVITESGFLSTTMDLKVAQSPAFAGNVEFRILSATGRDISSFSVLPDEQEVLFPTGSKFYVVDRKTDPDTGLTVIEMLER